MSFTWNQWLFYQNVNSQVWAVGQVNSNNKIGISFVRAPAIHNPSREMQAPICLALFVSYITRTADSTITTCLYLKLKIQNIYNLRSYNNFMFSNMVSFTIWTVVQREHFLIFSSVKTPNVNLKLYFIKIPNLLFYFDHC